MKDLSVIIVSYKGWERLQKCLSSLKAFTGSKFSMEVIVVDNSSDVKMHEIEKRFPEFRFIYNPENGGYANGNNLGAKDSTVEFFLFLNPDTVVREDETGKLLQAAKSNPGYNILSCRQVNETGKENHVYGKFPGIGNLTGFQRSIAELFKSVKTDTNNSEVLFPDWVSGSVIMIKNDLFRSINGFDEDFWMYYEDVDICRRIRDIGGEVAFYRNMTIEHNHGGSSRINSKVASITKTEVNISRHVYVNKHLQGSERIISHILLITVNLVGGFLLAVPGALLFIFPKLFVKTLVFIRLLKYYTGALRRLTWVSPQSLHLKNAGHK
jgi:GT2 family glycosyltransferase